MSKQNTVTIIVVAVLALVAAGFIFWAANTGRLVVKVSPQAGGASGIAPVVCGAEDIEQYNGAVLYEIRQEGDSDYAINPRVLRSVMTEIPERPGASGDATCQTIVFFSAVGLDEREVAERAYDKIAALRKKGVFPNSDLYMSSDFAEYRELIDAIE